MFLLPPCAEGFVRGADGQSERFPLCKHLAGDVEVRAVLLVQTGKPQHRVLQQRLVALLLSLSFQTTAVGEEWKKKGKLPVNLAIGLMIPLPS